MKAKGALEAMGPQPRDLTPYASALHYFGAELRHYRQLAGLSLRRLGPQVFVSPSQLGLVEAARRFPSIDLAGRCDDVLNTGGVLTRMHPLLSAERAERSGGSATPVIGTQQLSVLLRLIAAAGDLMPLGGAEPATSLVDRIDRALNSADLHMQASLGVPRRPSGGPGRRRTAA